MTTIEHSIDLRWSLWTANVREIKPEIVLDMRRAFNGSGNPVLVKTAPKKEIRFGKVQIEQGHALVTFHFEWDEPYEQVYRVEELVKPDMDEGERQKAIGLIQDFYVGMTWYVYRDVRPKSFIGLMKGIDAVESDLLALEDRQSKAHENNIKFIAEYIRNKRKEQNERSTERRRGVRPSPKVGKAAR